MALSSIKDSTGRMRVRLAIPLFLLIGAVILSGCADRRSSEKVTFAEWIPVPSNVNFIVSVRLGEVLADPDVASLVESLPSFGDEPLTLDSLLAEATEEVGIDLRQISRFIVFGDLDSNEYFGALIEGNVDQEQFLAKLEESLNESPRLEDYKGHELYVFSDEGLTLVWLDSDAVLAASSDLVMAKDVIDVVERDAEPESGPVMGLFGTLGDPWVKGAFEVPQQPTGDDELTIPGLDLSLLTDIRSIGLVVDKVQSDFHAEVSLRYPTEERAEQAADVLDSLVTLITAFTDDQYISGFIDPIEISSEGSIATAAYNITVDELLSAIEDLTDLAEEFLGDFGLGDELFGFDSAEPVEIDRSD